MITRFLCWLLGHRYNWSTMRRHNHNNGRGYPTFNTIVTCGRCNHIFRIRELSYTYDPKGLE